MVALEAIHVDGEVGRMEETTHPDKWYNKFSGKANSLVPVWLFGFSSCKQQIPDMLLPAHLSCVQSDHGLA